MRNRTLLTLWVALFVATTVRAYSECDDLTNVTPQHLLELLNWATTSRSDAKCLTQLIRKIGDVRDANAAGSLTRFLDFRRPPTDREQQGLYLRPQTIDELYPAAYALEMIGRPALPALAQAIESSSTSVLARENAIAVWMEIYKDEPSEGVASLMTEAQRSNDAGARDKLTSAAFNAVKWCGPAEVSKCKAALAGTRP